MRKIPKGDEEMPQEVMVPLPNPTPPQTRPPAIYTGSNDEEIIVAAAQVHQRSQRTIDELKRYLAEAEALLSAKDQTVNELKLILSQERNHAANIRGDAEHQIRTMQAKTEEQIKTIQAKAEETIKAYRDERDRAIQDRADLCALFGNIYTILEKFELPIRLPRSKPAAVVGNGGDTAAVVASGSVPDENGGAEKMAE